MTELPPDPRDAPIPFSWRVAAVMVLYVAGVTFAWYNLEGWPWRTSPSVPYLFSVGGVVFFLAVWAFRRVAPWRHDKETLVVAVTSLVYLTLLWMHGRQHDFRAYFRGVTFEGELRPLYPFFYFALSCFFTRTILPLLTIKLVLRRHAADFGYKLRGTFKLWWVYVLAVAVVVPFVFYAATLPTFIRRYPLCRHIIQDGTLEIGHFAIYQVFYGLVFISGESFWRGYILFGLSRRLGYNALFFMVMPYVLSHFGKPMPETFGAIATGLFLGFLALKHRSFWLGVAAHWTIAMLMDVLAVFSRDVRFV